ncbi:unnamed protein product [Linum tenue]|uniref:RING-type E3 ubiquitin transferase n=1 Tax=Linum tenue TaxID=586396 RepID=A0AAV0HWV0_9ROSI|nr:unnamed protein product [Linum tenue]
MISFGRKSDENYFDKIHISSQLSSHSEYQFSADEQLLSEACSSKLDQNKVKCYEGEGFCQTLRDIVNNDILELVLQSTGSSNNDQSSNKLGPFTLESGTIDASSPLGILIHHVQCQQHGDGNITAAKVAAVLRVVDARDKLSTNSGRTGLSTMTLSAEGIWRSGHELCMVACVGSITEHRRSSEELTINVGAVELEVLSLGSFIWGWNLGNKRSTHDIDPPSNEEEESTIEVSGLLKLKSPYDISLSFEGIYNQLTGQMHLVGCRDIGGFRNVSSVEEGMDCEYEIRVEYPSTSTRWLLYPRARISINSRRDNSDPFYFPSVSLMTPFPYLGQPDDMMFRETFERTLRLLMLAISVQLIARQHNYMTAKKRDNPNTIAAASVSIIMVAIQAYGYGLPLYTSIEAMFSPQHDYLSDLVTKFLLVFALARTLQLWKKVIQSRASHRHERAQLNLRDTKAFFITSAVLAAGFFLSLHISLLDHDEAQRAASSNEPELNFIQYKYTHWPTEEATNDVFQGLAGYPGIVVDLFLVPQAIGNALWNRGGGKQQQATKALTSSYYIGFTALSVFVKVYECVRYPVARGKEKWYGLPRIDIKEHDYYGNLRNMMVAAAVIAVAVVVHLQQQQQKVDRTGKKKAVASDDRDLEEQLLPGSAKIM